MSKTPSGMPCYRSTISIPSSLMGETGTVAEGVGDGVVAENVCDDIVV